MLHPDPYLKAGSSMAEQEDGANQLRRRAEKSRERAMYLEQAVSWCTGRIRSLEAENKSLKADAKETMRRLMK
jgi:hypothetical protein